MTRPVLYLDGPKIAKRTVKCRVCGKEIHGGETYWIEEWYDGPYKRRRVLCTECAKRVFVHHIRELIVWSRWRAIDKCVMDTGIGLKAIEAAAISVLAPGFLTEEKRKTCQKIVEEKGFNVELTRREIEVAKKLGVNLEKLVKQLDTAAIIQQLRL